MSVRLLAARLIPLLALPVLAACDLFGPGGPGTLTARLEHPGEGLGAAVVEVGGTDLRGFSGVANSRVFDGFREDREEHRVLIVNPGTAGLAFGIEVDDLGAVPPAVRVVAAADTTNQTIGTVESVVVRIER